jgi:uncharacterized membrane protein YfcA
MWVASAIATAGVVLGTLLGSRVLSRIPDVWFHRVLVVVLTGPGTSMVVGGLSQG